MQIGAWLRGSRDAVSNPPRGAVACPDCGAVQALRAFDTHGFLHCYRCASPLERMRGRSLDAALACSLATFLLLWPANILPLLSVDILGARRSSVIASGVGTLWHQDWPLTAIAVAIEIVILPFFRYGGLVVVLGLLRAGVRGPALGRALRWIETIDQWAMPDVFLFGGFIGYSRVAPFVPTRIGGGAYCLIAAAFFSMVTRATFERRATWRLIGPSAERPEPGMVGCQHCDAALPARYDGARCPRCAGPVFYSRPATVARSLAFTVAGLVLYPIAYLYPMEANDRLDSLHPYSIMTGVMRLVDAHMVFFAAVVFVASIVIPFLKLFALAWFAISVHTRSNRRLRLKTRLYRMIVTIGRWSHIDVFTVAVFLPLMHLRGFLAVSVGWALPAFLAVVILTMVATDLFDPRAMWRAAEAADDG